VEDTSAAAIATALDQVGPRLKRLRTQRRLTLTGVAEAKGVRPGMRLGEALATCPELELVEQDPATAESPVMPQAVIDQARVDRILPLDRIGPYLVELCRSLADVKSGRA